MQCVFELAAYFSKAGDYSGEMHFTDREGKGCFCVCPVYIRVLQDNATGQTAALTARDPKPIVFDHGCISARVKSAREHPDPSSPGAKGKSSDPLDPLIRRTLQMLPVQGTSMDFNKKVAGGPLKDLFMPLSVKHDHVQDPGIYSRACMEMMPKILFAVEEMAPALCLYVLDLRIFSQGTRRLHRVLVFQ